MTTETAIQIITAALPTFALGLTAFNALVWPRGAAGGPPHAGTVSVLVPARNEEATIESTVRSALQDAQVTEVCVYDDGSTDGTGEILARIAREDSRLRIIEAQPLPAGWVGKPHACTRLGEAATGETLLFLDADVDLQPDGVTRIRSLMTKYGADAVTAVPRQRVGTWAEAWILPLLHTTYLSWLPLPLIWRTHDPRFLAANGQVLAVSRDAYDAVGGFASVSDAVVDDMAFCARLKTHKRRVVFADGDAIAECRMYESPAEVWRGFSKNIREGVGSTPGVFAVVALYLATFVWPWFAWIPALATSSATWWAAFAIGTAAVLLQRILIARRHHYPALSVFTVIPGVLGLCAIALNSVVWQHRDAIEWAGRTYVRRENRHG